MTTISPNRRRVPVSTALFSLLVLLVLLSFLVILFQAPLTNVFWRVMTPVVAARDALFSSSDTQLKAQLASTTAALADRDALYQENLQLKARLGRDAGVQTTLAAVIMRPPGVPYDTLMIDVGSQENIAPGDLVSAGGTLLIGAVAEVYQTTSRVALFSSPGDIYQGMLNGSVPVSVEGQGSGSMTGEVPAGTKVSAGDPIVLAGISGALTGTVSHVEAQDGQSFETLYLHLPVDLFSLQYVEVWQKTQ